MNTKEQLLKYCKEFVLKRQKTVNKTITSNQKALQSETKSSAGDKHETGRAMLQLEMEKAGQQLLGIQQMEEALAKINLSQHTNTAHLGSIVKTNNNNYFLSISVGQITIEKTVYFAVSVSSPIGRELLGKKIGDSFIFNKTNFNIQEIV